MKYRKLTPNLLVQNVGRSLPFYRDTLGFEVLAVVPPEGDPVFAILGAGDLELMLQSVESVAEDLPALASPTLGDPQGLSCICYVEVEGVLELSERIKDQVTVVTDLRRTDYGMTEFFIRDPDGNVLGFAERSANVAEGEAATDGRSAALAALRTVPNVGASIAVDLWDLGFRWPEELRDRDPEHLYEELCRIRGTHIDRCMLYVLRAVVYIVSTDNPDPELVPWWKWKDRRAPATESRG